MSRWSPIKAQMPNPIKAQMPNPNTVKCRDCEHRDRTSMMLDGKVLYVGVTRDTCDMYDHKPPEILFQNAECPNYIKG